MKKMTSMIHHHNALAIRFGIVVLIAFLGMSTLSLASVHPEGDGVLQDQLPPVMAADPQEALQSALDLYVELNPPAKWKYDLGEVYVEKEWAYAIARLQNKNAKNSLVKYVILLASYTPDGWLALAPGVHDPKEYNTLLHSFPVSLIDESSQAMFTLPEAEAAFRQLTAANFSEHVLPFPAGVNGYVPKKNGSGHENQVDFNIAPGDTVYATKPGRVVFVKESSNSGCNDLSCWQQANMVVVEHSSTEYSWYVHLAWNSVPVEVNSYVGLGTKIGVEGNTGYSSGVHLHYMISTGHTPWTDPANPNAAPWGTGMTPVNFDETTWDNLVVGRTYTSRNTSDPSAVSWGNGRIDLFVHGEDNVLWQRTFNGAWGNWTSLGGILVSAPDAASWNFEHMDVYVRGLNNNIYYKRYLNGSWTDWASAGQPSVGATSDPSAVSRGYGLIDLFVRGGDNALWRRAYRNGGWGNWESLGGILTTGPDAAASNISQLQIFVAGLNKVMWRCTYNNLISSYTWDQVPGGASNYDQSAVSPSWNRVDVFARGMDYQLYHRIWNGSAWGNWEPLGGFLTSGPDAASYRVNNHLDVFVRGSDNNIYHRWQNGGGWSGWEGLGKP